MQEMTDNHRKTGSVAMDDASQIGSRNTDKYAAGRTTKKPVMQMVLFGAISLTGYIVLFNNEKLITTEFTMGGWHAAYPVLTALLFSFIHGAFASNLLSVLGLEAKKK